MRKVPELGEWYPGFEEFEKTKLPSVMERVTREEPPFLRPVFLNLTDVVVRIGYYDMGAVLCGELPPFNPL
jgi:hypothetical protein